MSTNFGETTPGKHLDPFFSPSPRRTFFMRRNMRNLLFFLCCFLVFSIIYFPYDIFGDRLKSELKSVARRANILLEVEMLTVAFPGIVTMSKVEGNILRRGLVPFPFSLTEATIKPRYSALATFSAAIDSFISAYGGTFTARASRSFLSDDIELTVVGSAIDLEQHPVLQVYQVDGTFDFDFSAKLNGSINTAPVISDANLELDLKGGRFIPSKVGGTVSILPDFADTNIHLVISGTDRRFRTSECQLTSSLGSATCQGRIELNSAGALGFVSFTATIVLNEEGIARLGTLLALASNDASSTEKPRWKLSFSQTATNKGKFVAEPL